MEMRHLRYFVAVAEECHFGRAAARLHMAQPPLSQQIKQLEKELGVQLLERSTRKVSLTPAGERYLERARTVLAAVESAGAEAQRVAEGEIGHLSIGFVGSATYSLLPVLARALREEFPGISFEFRGEMLVPDLVAGLHSGSLDLAVIRPPVGEPDLDLRLLRSDRLVAALPEGHPLAAHECVAVVDLRDEPFISYPSRHRSVMYEVVIDTCRRAGFLPRQIHEVAETSTLVVFVAAGLGVSLVAESVSALNISGATFRPLEGAGVDVELAVAMRRGEHSPQTVRVLERIQALFGPDCDGPVA